MDSTSDEFVKIVSELEDMNLRSGQNVVGGVDGGADLQRSIRNAAPSAATNPEVDDLLRNMSNLDELPESSRLSRMGLPSQSPTVQNLVRQRNNLKALEEAFEQSGQRGVQKVMMYLTEVGDNANDAICNKQVLLRVADSADDSRALAKLFVQSGSAATTEGCLSTIDDVARLQRSGLGRLMGGAGVLASGAMVGFDVWMLLQEKEKMKQRVENVKAQLDQLVADGWMSKEGDTYKAEGVEISLTQIENMNSTQVEEMWGRTAVDTAALGVSGYMLATGALAGPAGLVVAGTIITVHVSIGQIGASIDQAKRQKFIAEAAPTWLIAMMRSSTLVGKKEEELMKENTGFMRSDILPHSWWEPGFIFNRISESSSGKRKELKRSIREKMLQSLAYSETSARFGDLLAELPNGDDPQRLLDPEGEFLRKGGDYDRFVRRAATISLHANFDSDPLQSMNRAELWAERTQFPFKETESLDITLKDGSWMSRTAEYITEGDLDRAAMTGMLWYVQHRRHRWYLDERKKIEGAYTADPAFKEYITKELDEKVRRESHRYFVFNRHPNTFPLTEQTQPEMLLDRVYSAVSSARDSESAQFANRNLPSLQNGKTTSIGVIYRDYLVPDVRVNDYAALRSYDERNPDLPYSFEEMENWGDRESFRKKFVEEMGPLHYAEKALREAKTQRDLEYMLEKHLDKVEKYFGMQQFRWFYENYCKRRQFSIEMFPGEPTRLMKLMHAWHHEGRPELLNGEFIESVKNDPSWREPKVEEQFSDSLHVPFPNTEQQQYYQDFQRAIGNNSHLSFSSDALSDFQKKIDDMKIKGLPKINGFDPKNQSITSIDVTHIDADVFKKTQFPFGAELIPNTNNLLSTGTLIPNSQSHIPQALPPHMNNSQHSSQRPFSRNDSFQFNRSGYPNTYQPSFGNTPTWNGGLRNDSFLSNDVYDAYGIKQPEEVKLKVGEILTNDGAVSLSRFNPSYGAFAIHSSRVPEFLKQVKKNDHFDALRMHILKRYVFSVSER